MFVSSVLPGLNAHCRVSVLKMLQITGGASNAGYRALLETRALEPERGYGWK